MAIDELSKGIASSMCKLIAWISEQGHNHWFNMDFHNLLQTVPGTFTVVAIGFLTLTFVFFWILHKRKWNSCMLPPGPYPLPIIGNLHQLKLPAHRTLGDLAQKYGPIMFLRLGSVPTVVVSSSEMAKQFLKTHDSIFTGRPLMAAGKYLGYNYKGIAMAPCGDHWSQMRKICALELLSAKRIKSFKDVREEEVSAMISSIWEESERGTRAVNISNASSALANNIVWRILAGRKFSENDLGDNSEGFKDLVSEISTTLGGFNIGDFIPYLDWLDLQGIKGRMKKAGERFDAFAEKLIDGHIDRRRAILNGQVDAEAEPVKDVVDVLLNMAEADKSEIKITREKIKALVLDIFGGGAAGTFTTIEWAMSELFRHPHAIRRLQEEIESVIGKHRKVNESDLASMKYLQCVVKETLRLYPAGPLTLPRESVGAVTVAGYYIPNKTLLMVNLWAMGRDPNLWGADASEFKPERFMEEEYIDFTGQSDFKMLPFGAGRRGCPGYPMAIPIVELTLAQLLHVFDWRVEVDPSQLDMKEACGASMPRQKYRLYLKRLSGVAQQQSGMNSSFGGTTEAGVGPMGLLGRLDLQRLAASGQISPQALVTLPAELLGQVNPNNGLGLPNIDRTLLLQAAFHGVNSNPLNRGKFGQPLMNSQGNLLQGLPRSIELKQFSQPQQHIPSFGNLGLPTNDASAGFSMLQQQHNTGAEVGSVDCGINNNGASNPQNNVMVMQLIQQQQQHQINQQQQQLQRSAAQQQPGGQLQGSQLQSGQVLNLPSASIVGPQVLPNEIRGRATLSSLANGNSSLGNNIIGAPGSGQLNRMPMPAYGLGATESNVPEGIGGMSTVDYKSQNVHILQGNDYSLSSTVCLSSPLTTSDIEGGMNISGIKRLGGISDIVGSPTLSGSGISFGTSSGIGQNLSQSGRQGWQMQNVSMNQDLSQTATAILSPCHGQASHRTQGLNVPVVHDPGQVRSFGFVGKGPNLSSRLVQNAGYPGMLSNAQSQGELLGIDSGLRLKDKSASDFGLTPKIECGTLSDHFPSEDLMNLLFKQQQDGMGISENEFNLDGVSIG